jgi:hypothetical protein
LQWFRLIVVVISGLGCLGMMCNKCFGILVEVEGEGMLKIGDLVIARDPVIGGNPETLRQMERNR